MSINKPTALERLQARMREHREGLDALYQTMKRRDDFKPLTLVFDDVEGTLAEVSIDAVSGEQAATAKQNVKNTYLPDDTWKALSAALVEASENPADPQTEIEIVLAEFNIMPEMCREDCEAA